VIVHLARARDGLLVASVAAAAEVPYLQVLAAAQRIGTAAATGGELPARALASLPAGETPRWRIWDEAATGPGGGADRFTAVLPAWSARSELDLADPGLGFAAVAAALGGGDPWTAAQSAVARYTRAGFEAAAVTAMAVTASARRPAAGRRRAAQLRFGQPYAVAARATADSSSERVHGAHHSQRAAGASEPTVASCRDRCEFLRAVPFSRCQNSPVLSLARRGNFRRNA
jgi:hypothetical protein